MRNEDVESMVELVREADMRAKCYMELFAVFPVKQRLALHGKTLWGGDSQSSIFLLNLRPQGKSIWIGHTLSK